MKNSRQIIYFAFKFLVFNLIFFFFLSEIAAQQLWQDIEESKISDKGTRYITPDKFRTYALNEEDLKQVLKAAPLERTKAATTNPVYFSMPMPDGTMKVFEIVNSPVMASELAAKYPEIQTYAGYEIDDPENTVRFDLTPQGFHAMIFTREFGTVYIDPYSFDKKGYYIVYKREDIRSKMPIDFECGVLDEPTNITKSMLVQPPLGDCTLRTYRLAIAATGEYTAFHGGTVPLALAAQVTTMNRVNGIYMREMAIFMEIIANNDAIIYTDAATDPYTNGAATTMIGEAQTDCDNNIGNNNYDIGHVFGTTGGGFSGFASIGVTCLTGSKGRGVSTAGTPVGDLFDAYLVPHEMGHQFGANHTFNNACDFGGGPNRNNGTAYEPGAGSTIMAYASTPCTPAYQAADDDYFHVSSLEEISNTILGTSCATLTALANTAPTVNNVPTGLTIPGGTPFELTANATDPDGDVLTYCWEQMDNEISTQPPDPTSPNGPNFRSNPPVNSPTRYFPNLPDLIASVTPVWEVLATVDRTFNFRVTVRDNAMGGGCAFYEEAVINVDGDSGPFIVQNPNAPGITWTVNANETVTWTVAGTNNAPVNCANVDILLSIDGGLTYPITLATNTPNDGNADVQVPNNVTTTARVKIICSDNVFFDISDNDFTIIPQVIITITCPDDVTATCAADVVAGIADLQTDCPTGGGNVAVTGPVVNGNPDCPGTTHTYTFTGTDNCGQTTSCTQVFTIVNNGPIITECPAAATVACVADIVPGTPIYTTSCNLGATISITGPVISSATPDCPGTTYTYTHIVTDVCGRTASCEQVFTIQNDAPTISCPADAVVFCAADIVVDAATYTVSCGVNATLEVTGPVILGTPDCPGTTYTYTHTVTDVCGRTASCQQVFTIQNAGPTITCPAGGVVACAANIVVGTATYTVSCGVDATLNVTGPVISDTPDCPGTTYTYTHTVTDVCGRTASCEQVFTIQNAGPTISCPAGDVVSCETEINVGTATYTVSCGMDATLTRSGPVMNGDPHCDGTTYTYTHTVTDACGRTASCEQVFTISNECEGIDFNDLPAGTIVSDQYPGVTISTNNPYHEPAMIFDTGNPTGNDYDLGTPNQAYGGPGMGTGFGNTEFQGNALIVSKDRNIPNETEGKLIFEFDCPVIIRNIDFLDMECDYNTVKLYDADYNLIEEIDLPDYGENSFHTEEINVGGVSKMVVNFPCAGGAITNLKYCKDNTPGALCGVCDEGLLNFSDSGVYWSDDATSGTYTAGYQTFDIDISDADNILEDTNEDNDGLEIGIDPYSVTDEVRIIYTLAEVASHVIFDIVDLDYKNSSSSKQQEAVCVYGLLGGSQVQIMPTITSLNGSVSINGNCAEATANSASSGDDESILVTFDDCIDQIVIEYGTGSNSPTVYPSYSSITIGKDYGFYTQYCEGACTGCTVFGDFDGDGVCNDLDICMTGDDNADADGDGLPDACDGNCDPSNGGGDADSDGVCDDLDICPNGNDNIDENNNGIPDACDDVCVDYVLDFSCENGWADNATSGSYTVGQQTFNINADDNDNILVDTEQEGFGINVGIDPETVDDEVVITYTLSEVSNHVVFDIVDLDYKNSGSSKQQEAVCVYGLLGASQVQIMPIITSLDGSVSINGNCAEATTNSATSGDDESILVTFDECIDQVVIVYGTGSNSPTVYPSYSSITIGQNLGMSTQVCESACVVDCGSSGDDDNDGVCNDQDICPNGDDNADVDGDGTPDACDEDCASAGDDDNDGVCNDVDQCPGGNDNIDDDNNGIPDACDVNCDQSMLDFSEAGYHWNSHATSGNFTAAGQTYDINITDADNILEYTGEDDLGIKIAIDPDNTSDELVMTYQLSAASDNVVFDIVDLDRKTGGSKQQEAVCVYGLLGNDLTEIMPVISQLDGSVAINGNCAEATANSSYSGDDESVLITFTDCIDQVVIVYGTGSNSPANDPSYSSITIGEYLGFSSLVCDTPCDGSQREDESEATINIYPNPTSSGSTISITVDNVYEDADLLIYDELGRLIVQDNLSLTGGTTTYDLSARAFAGGVYFVKIRTAAWTTNTYKLVVID